MKPRTHSGCVYKYDPPAARGPTRADDEIPPGPYHPPCTMMGPTWAQSLSQNPLHNPREQVAPPGPPRNKGAEPLVPVPIHGIPTTEGTFCKNKRPHPGPIPTGPVPRTGPPLQRVQIPDGPKRPPNGANSPKPDKVPKKDINLTQTHPQVDSGAPIPPRVLFPERAHLRVRTRHWAPQAPSPSTRRPTSITPTHNT